MPGIDFAQTMQTIAVAAIPVLFAITLHEVAHGWVALRFGDRTAELLGRLTINPLKHIDPIGTVVVPLVLLFSSGFLFGWARPVPVNPYQLKNPKRDMIAVAVAGPVANLLMALFWVLFLRIVLWTSTAADGPGEFFARMAGIGLQINILLAVFNLVPIPPLDGSRVLRGVVSEEVGRKIDRIEPFGLIIVVVLLLSGLLWRFVGPIMQFVQDLYLSLVGII